MKRLRSGEEGAGLVELALVVPMLLLLAVGIWEFGRVLDAQVVVTNAAREGARYATLGKSDTAVRDRVQDYLDDGLAGRLGSGEITFTSASVDIEPTGARTVGEPVSVDVPITVQFYVPGVLGLGNTIVLTGTASMRVECGGAAC